MKFIDKIKLKISHMLSKSSASWDSVFLRNLDLDLESDIQRDPFSKSSIVYTCITTTMRAISQIPLIIMEKANDGNKRKFFSSFRSFNNINVKQYEDRKYITSSNGFKILIDDKSNIYTPVSENNPWQILFDKPNYLMSQSQFIQYIIGYLMLDGNSWILGYPWQPSIEPLALWPIKKDFIEDIKDQHHNLVGWKYRPEGQFGQEKITVFLDERIGHVKFFNPNNLIYGFRPLEAGKISLASDYKAAKYNDKFFENGASLQGTFETDQFWSQPQIDAFKTNWKQKYAGYKRAFESAFLHGGLKYKPISLSQTDMQYIDLRKWTRDEILQILGMKKGVISVTEDLNYATFSGQKKEWWQSTNYPIMKMLENVLNANILVNTPYKVFFDISQVKALQEDLEQKIKSAKELWTFGMPFDVINEKLELGFPSFPGSNVGYLPYSLAPTTFISEPEIEEDTEEGKALITVDPYNITKRLSEPLKRKKTFKFKKDSIEDVNFAIWENYATKAWKSVDRKGRALERGYRKKVERVFFEMRKATLQILNGDKKSKDTRDDRLAAIHAYNFKVEKRLLRKYSEGYYKDASLQGAESLAGEVGIELTFDLDSPIAVDYVKRKKTKIVRVVGTAKRRVERTIKNGIENDLSMNEIIDQVKITYNSITSHAATVARTEIFGALNFGRSTQMKDSSYKKKTWFTANDERVRGNDSSDEFDHTVMHGVSINMKDNWIVGGEELQYPGDDSGSAGNIINDRCIETVDINSL